MSNPTREHLLGYLLGALERREHEQVEEELARNPRLQEELHALQRVVSAIGLDDEPLPAEPPRGLAARTCQFIDLQQATDVTVIPRAATAERPAGTRSQFSFSDLLVAAAVLVASATLFFPALASSRFQANVASCQNHLRHVGFALHEYSEAQSDRTFPEVQTVGNRAAAGIYAPMLVNGQWVSDPRLFVCPASPLAGDMRDWEVPSLEKLDRAIGPALAKYHRTMGGSYGFTLGYSDKGSVRPPQNKHRSNYALLADAPSDAQPARRTLNHQGRGQNVLYEDGHIEFLKTLPAPNASDDPFHNRHGIVAAGVDKDDSVIGKSADRPLPLNWISENR